MQLREVDLQLMSEVERLRSLGTTHLTRLLKRTVSWYRAKRAVLEWKDARGTRKKKKEQE